MNCPNCGHVLKTIEEADCEVGFFTYVECQNCGYEDSFDWRLGPPWERKAWQDLRRARKNHAAAIRES